MIVYKRIILFLITLSVFAAEVRAADMLSPAGVSEINGIGEDSGVGISIGDPGSAGIEFHEGIKQKLSFSFKDDKSWSLSGKLNLPYVEIDPQVAQKAIERVFLNPYNSILRSCVNQIFERTVKAAEIKKVTVSRIQGGTYAVVLRVDVVMQKEKKRSFVLNMSRFADKNFAMALMKEFEFMKKDYELFPQAFARPLARTGLRSSGRFNIMFVAYEYVENIEEVNLLCINEQMRFAWNVRGRPLNKSEELEWLEDLTALKVITYDEERKVMPVFMLSAGDINKRVKSAKSDFGSVVISEKIRVHGVEGPEFLEYLFHNFEFSTEMQYFNYAQSAVETVRAFVKKNPIIPGEEKHSRLNRIVWMIQLMRNPVMNIEKDSFMSFNAISFNDEGGAFIAADVEPDEIDNVLLGQQMPPEEESRYTAYLRGIVKGLYYKYGDEWEKKLIVWMKGFMDKEVARSVFTMAKFILFEQLQASGRLIEKQENKAGDVSLPGISLLALISGKLYAVESSGEYISLDKLVEVFKASAADRFPVRIDDIVPSMTINGISRHEIEQLGAYEPANGDIIYLNFDPEISVPAASAVSKSGSGTISKNAEVMSGSN